ncbi:chloride channel protein [Dysgonomonas sp. 216]|uniref:chloride channel protein n=1 Tax=Dysgonomonas sp. 216 TaxID=2302934 RepID=UPI0013D03ADB|nr:chloride channel protein [Dysgonomonas sp. 216]NDW19577.1 chloride channel protein [Dysgonomonas sp. 216]
MVATLKRYFNRFLTWKNKNIKEQHFLMFVSFLIGLFTACAALILKTLIHFIQTFLTDNLNPEGVNYVYLILPIIGILLGGLYVRYIVRDDISHGVTKILYAISQRKSYIKPHNMYTSVVASSVTIGFGGSVGAEAPIVLTGAAIGSNLGRAFKLEPRHLMLLLGCGAAGAIAGIFKAPIAGLIFVIEVLMIDLTLTTVLPLLVSSVTAATFAYITTGSNAMFEFSHGNQFEMERIPFVILLGLFCGLVSLYFTRAMSFFEDKMRPLGYWTKFIICACILSILIFFLPPLYGEGYDTINQLLVGLTDNTGLMDGSIFYQYKDFKWGIIWFLAPVLLLKVFASSSTNGGGGTGGIFAPSLFLGCVAGYIFSYWANNVGFGPGLPQQNFALMGMAGVMAGVMHAPLTGTFLIAELTGGYELFLPLMIVSMVSYATIKLFEPHSIYAMRLAKKGELLTHHKDRAILTLMSRKELIEKNFETVKPDMTLGDVVTVISRSPRNVFPVIDDNNKLMGIVLIDNIRNIMFRPDLYDRFKVKRFMVSPPAVIVVNMTIEKIMRLFDDTKAWNLPVVDENGVYQGFFSKSSVLNTYREVLVENFSEKD